MKLPEKRRDIDRNVMYSADRMIEQRKPLSIIQSTALRNKGNDKNNT